MQIICIPNIYPSLNLFKIFETIAKKKSHIYFNYLFLILLISIRIKDGKVVMMKKNIAAFFIVLYFLMLFSCATSSGTTTEIVSSGNTVNMNDARARAETARDKALTIKADVAVKDDFSSAMNIFETAETSADPVAAYLDAEKLFVETYDKAKILRDAAIDELEKAQIEIKTAEDEAAAFENEKAANEETQEATQ
jgi:hypothetical protein